VHEAQATKVLSGGACEEVAQLGFGFALGHAVQV
jgi:hypothetical protein